MLTGLFDPSKVKLRPYQEAMVASVEAAKDRQLRSGLIVAATGTGKTTVIAEVIRRGITNTMGFQALCLAHRHELLDQIASRVRNMVPDAHVSIHAGGQKAVPGSDVVVASVQSIGRIGALDGLGNWFAPTDIITDEAHHAPAPTYQSVYRSLGCYDPDNVSAPFHLGLTATAHRLDGLALEGNRAIYQEQLYCYDIVAAIKDGYLADLKGYRAMADMDLSGVKTTAGDYNLDQLEAVVNVAPVNELAFKSWQEKAGDRQTIVFCSGVDHAHAMTKIFTDQGISAAAVWGDMDKEARRQVIAKYHEGKIQVLCNMDILTEGFDAQATSCIILLRPTKSWALFCQMVGRGLRVLPGVLDGLEDSSPEVRRHAVASSPKPECLVIDIVGNVEAHKLNDKPEDNTTPSIQGMLGIPGTLELDGMSVIDALEQFENLPPIVQAAAMHRKTTFAGLRGVLQQVELLAELEEPEEVKQAGARFTWLKPREEHYIVLIGGMDDTLNRRAELTRDSVGRWNLHLSSTRRDEHYVMDHGGTPFAWAEGLIREEFPGVARFADKSSPQRHAAPTSIQLDVLRRLGIDPLVLQALDRGKAAALIETTRQGVKGY